MPTERCAWPMNVKCQDIKIITLSVLFLRAQGSFANLHADGVRERKCLLVSFFAGTPLGSLEKDFKHKRILKRSRSEREVPSPPARGVPSTPHTYFSL